LMQTLEGSASRNASFIREVKNWIQCWIIHCLMRSSISHFYCYDQWYWYCYFCYCSLNCFYNFYTKQVDSMMYTSDCYLHRLRRFMPHAVLICKLLSWPLAFDDSTLNCNILHL
jgi:hypothetical protein